jgi:uncharacterized RDD family membrane protein YckC
MESPLYGRFSRRLQAVLIDWIVILLLIFGAVFIAVTLDSQSLARTLGFSVAAGWLLYEPLLVSLTGSTIGHYVRNLRVVDNRTGGNINFFKAVARTVIKAVLGWLSFITMGTTRRYQAMHDLLTRSTVQIRNPAKASAYHYNSEQTELSSARMPSRVRRLVTIGLYLIAITFIFLVASLALEGMVSPACVNNQYRCSTNEQALLAALSLSWIGACILCIVLGWRGRLIGAQMTRAPS